MHEVVQLVYNKLLDSLHLSNQRIGTLLKEQYLIVQGVVDVLDIVPRIHVAEVRVLLLDALLSLDGKELLQVLGINGILFGIVPLLHEQNICRLLLPIDHFFHVIQIECLKQKGFGAGLLFILVLVGELIISLVHILLLCPHLIVNFIILLGVILLEKFLEILNPLLLLIVFFVQILSDLVNILVVLLQLIDLILVSLNNLLLLLNVLRLDVVDLDQFLHSD